MSAESNIDLEVAVIGAGFAGLGTAIGLQQSGCRHFRVFDQAAGVGGTWWVNRYPGCACDVPSHLYSFSFAPNPHWSRRYAPRSEIQAYLESLVERHELSEQVQLNTEIVSARWQDHSRHWLVEEAGGRRWRARILVSALGGLSRPAWPDIPGLSEFAGQVVHSQQWPQDLDLSGQRVAVIGTGASAVQFVPHVTRTARELAIYQRTPNWIIPRPDRTISASRQQLYRRLPLLQKLARFGIWAISELRVPAFLWSNRLAAGHRLLAHWHRRRQLGYPRLRAALRPDYDIGCKRVLLSSDFYPALNQEHVELVTAPIERIEPDGIVDATGRKRPADTLLLATGFRATEPVPGGLIHGRKGLDLAEAWRDGPQAYKGTTVHGFPNLFVLLGPNTALGHNSVIMMIESQIRYLLDARAWMHQHDVARVEVRSEAQQAWNTRLQKRLAGSVWQQGGCSSWYLHPETGRNSTIWPGFTLGFRRHLARFDPQAYGG